MAINIFDKIAKTFGRDPKDQGTPLAPVETAVEQSSEELELVRYIKDKIDLVRQSNSRIALEGVMFTNVAYLLGFDGVYFDTTYRQFRNVDPKRRLSRQRFKINKILPSVQNRLARLTQNEPKYDVRPNSNTSQDKDCARLGIQVIDDIFDKQNFVEKNQDMLMEAMKGGVAYMQVVWDEMLGEPMFDPESDELIGYEGDIRLEVLNLLEVFSDPLAKSLEDAEWWIKAKVRKLDYFKDRWPDRGHAVKEEDVWLLSTIYDLKTNAMTSVGIVGAQTNEQTRNSAIEIVYHEKRSKNYPNGRKIVIASGILLEDKELPVGEFDLVKFDDILVGGRYHSEAVITHLRPIQDQYNITRSRMANWVKQHLGGKFMVAKGSGLMQEAINNGDSEVLEYNPVAGAPPPMALEIPQIPQYAYEEIRELSGEFDFISGINEATRGVSPGSSVPFRAMALLVEQDQTRIAVQTTRNERGYAKLGSLILKYAGKNYKLPRMLKTAGDGLEYAVKEFLGADLQNNFDVVVLPGSTLPSSKVLKRQDIINAFQMGLLGDPGDPKLRSKVLKMLEFGDSDEMWREQALDTQQVKKLIASIADGSVDLKNPGHEWDNHAFFIQEMNLYRKSDKFEEMSPRQKAEFNYIAEWHLNALVALTNPQIPIQQQMAEQMANTMHKKKMEQQLQNQQMGAFSQPNMGQGPAVQPIQPQQPGGSLPQPGQIPQSA
jgi:hypothetical protein